ncbi:MAG: type II toxin-antitoxin system RelB/DinJ family antitoxin [Spirochaetales bacterium]|nr:type II toxin-antitoxin system RelB/DinJ family antitoxin [Spirochaetales bacterium]
MPKVATNISLDPELKKASQELYADLGMDLTTAITIFLKQSLRVQGMPFAITRDEPNEVTRLAMKELEQMENHPEKFKRYKSFKTAMDEILEDA